MSYILPKTMHAVLLKAHGGPEQLEYRTDVAVPEPRNNEVLIKVGAAGVNNTDINTRIGWYSKQVTGETNAGAVLGFTQIDNDDASWSGVPLTFPLIQGADCCGHIVAVGAGVDPSRVGQRVLVRNMLRAPVSNRPYECWTYGSECNGSFAQYAVAPDSDTWAVNSDWTDIELASIPCSYSTAEVLLQRSNVQSGDKVLITGASGGVGSAAVQLAKCRGAEVIAICSASKAQQVLELGADRVIPREADLLKELDRHSVTVVLDLVGGDGWPNLLEVLKRGGRYAVSGAIGGPIVALDLRTLYLKDLTFYGCTWQDDNVFNELIRRLEENQIRPFVSNIYPLSDIAEAQQHFVEKRFAGKLVLVPPQEDTA